MNRRRYKRITKQINRLRRRRIHCYCVGAAKTGTTSIAASFKSHYRAVHEPEVYRTNKMIINYLEGKVTERRLNAELIKRDKRLNLEMESSHPLGYVAGALASLFPDAKFIVTIREPYAWLESRLNFHYKKQPPQWRRYRRYFWTSRQMSYAPEEEVLAKMGLCSLDVYLSQYADHYRRVLTEVPEDQRLIVKTSQITNDVPAISAFVGCHLDAISAFHSNRQPKKITPLEKIDKKFVAQRIRKHCHGQIAKYFPESLPDGIYCGK